MKSKHSRGRHPIVLSILTYQDNAVKVVCQAGAAMVTKQIRLIRYTRHYITLRIPARMLVCEEEVPAV